MLANSIVPIYTNRENGFFFEGTGFFVSSTLLVTAAHVVRGGGEYLLIDDDYIKLELLSCEYNPLPGINSNDLAIYKTPLVIKCEKYLIISSDLLDRFSPCSLIACKKSNSDDGQKAIITKLVSIKCEMGFGAAFCTENKILLHLPNEMKNSIEKCMSGGPIIDADGKVIGVFYGIPTAENASHIFTISSSRVLETINSLSEY